MRLTRGISALALIAALAAPPAMAGFEWVAPKEDMSRTLELPTPKPGTPRISADPMNAMPPDNGLDPLPPLTVDQENGTRATVYRGAPVATAPMPEPAPIAPRRRAAPMVTDEAPREQARLKTLDMNDSADEPRMAGRAAAPLNDNQPRQLRMVDKLQAPDDATIAPAHEGDPLPEAQGQVAINPAPLAAAAPQYAAAPPAAPALPDGPILEGFGSELPLALALQQIVPPEYAYSFAGGVNPGESVSWEGGKAWTQVLSEMLDAKGLRATIQGRSIQIKSADGMVSPRAEAESESNITTALAETLANTAPAAGDSSESPEETVEKVEAVPPVYPPEVLGKSGQTQSRVLASISENEGLRLEDVSETVQMQGSPEAAAKAKREVSERAIGLIDDASATPPETTTEITSFAVTTTTRQVVEDSPVALPAPAAKPAPLAAPKAAVPGKVIQRRSAITDPGEQPSQQPEVQSLNTQSVPAEPLQLAAADIPQTPPSLIPPEAAAPSLDTQRKKLEDMARQQGIVLDAKNYNNDALGKIFNNGIAPAAGEQATLPTNIAAPAKNTAPSLPAPSLPAPDVGLEKKPAAPAAAQPAAAAKAVLAPAPAKPAALVEEAPAAPAENAETAEPAPLAATPSTSRPNAVDQPIKRIRAANANPGADAAAAAKAGGAMMWEAAKGADLKDTLTAWSKHSRVQLVWNAKANYALGSTIMVFGGFNDAMKALFAEGSKSAGFPVMRFTDDGAGTSMLVVDDKAS